MAFGLAITCWIVGPLSVVFALALLAKLDGNPYVNFFLIILIPTIIGGLPSGLLRAFIFYGIAKMPPVRNATSFLYGSWAVLPTLAVTAIVSYRPMILNNTTFPEWVCSRVYTGLVFGGTVSGAQFVLQRYCLHDWEAQTNAYGQFERHCKVCDDTRAIAVAP